LIHKSYIKENKGTPLERVRVKNEKKEGMKKISFILGLIFTLTFASTMQANTLETNNIELLIGQTNVKNFQGSKIIPTFVGNVISQGFEIQSITFISAVGELKNVNIVTGADTLKIKNATPIQTHKVNRKVSKNKLNKYIFLERIFDIGDVKNNIV